MKAELYAPSITIVAGDSGVGKSFFLYHHPMIWEGKKTIILDVERRWNEMIRMTPLRPLPNNVAVKNPIYLKDDGSIDYIRTYDYLKDFVSNVKIEKPDLIIIDGISDIRTMCHEAWCIMNNRKHAVNPFEWGQVNQMQRQIIMNLINLARNYEIKLYMSVLLVESFEDSKAPEAQYLNGLQIELKRQIKAQVDELAIIYKDKGQRIYSTVELLGAKSFRPDHEWIIDEFAEEVA